MENTLPSTPVINKGSKSEAGMLGEFKVYNVDGGTKSIIQY